MITFSCSTANCHKVSPKGCLSFANPGCSDRCACTSPANSAWLHQMSAFFSQQPPRSPSKEGMQPPPSQEEPTEGRDAPPAPATYSSSIRRSSPRTVSFRVRAKQGGKGITLRQQKMGAGKGCFGLQAQFLFQNVHLKSTLRSGHCSASVFLLFPFSFSDRKSLAADSVFTCVVLQCGKGGENRELVVRETPKGHRHNHPPSGISVLL